MADKKNKEGYVDPTAYGAMRHTELEEREKEAEIKKMMEHFRYISQLNGYEICNRIAFKDTKTGRTYR